MSIFAVVALIIMLLWNKGAVVRFVLVRFTGGIESEVESMNSRRIMNKMLNDLMWKNPIFGSGAGAGINYRDGFVENTYKEMICRLGFLGLFVFIFPLIKIIIDSVRYTVKETDEVFHISKYCIYATLISVMVATATNPYLITSFGLFIYCICMRVNAKGQFMIKE